MATLARSTGARVMREGSDSSAVFEPSAQPSLPLTVHRDHEGREIVQALHPHERGRVLLVHGAGRPLVRAREDAMVIIPGLSQPLEVVGKHLTSRDNRSSCLTIEASTVVRWATCPRCSCSSSRPHGRYRR